MLDRLPTVSTMYQRECKARTLSSVLRGKKTIKDKGQACWNVDKYPNSSRGYYEHKAVY